ncbi:unnamed protein product [Brassica rapa subsp. trilocularis]|uniref:(rape) hypothetical protein n=1 Tax=Brassica napus TaxID=3708 RepID=A0A816PNJ7_BRANA|nr:uncharacterized protein LOC106364054 [Brassica napus]CAF2049896.1 unnamed protein product [Brassica napus]
MNDPMGETGFSGESGEIVFSETEMAAAELLMQLSEEETGSCSSSTGAGGIGEGRGRKRRHEDISSRIGNEQNDGVKGNCDLAMKMKKMKEKKFRSLESIYRATKEIRG